MKWTEKNITLDNVTLEVLKPTPFHIVFFPKAPTKVLFFRHK
jgi:hypothetical protein